jgi:hypothetical protein
MRVLIACEESQAVCIEFRKLGHEAYSCDVQECSGGHPEWHIQDDVLKVINQGWDMMIGFPPCTHLAVSGAAWFEQKRKDGRQAEGIAFFMALVNAPVHKIAIENPIGIMSKLYRKPDQIIHPYYFGDSESKATCLWLKNLPKLVHSKTRTLFDEPTHVEPEYILATSGRKYSRIHWLGGGSGKDRSKTYSGIAKAMTQWLQ